MKKIIFLIFFTFLFQWRYYGAAPHEAELSGLERLGDGYYSLRNAAADADTVMANMDLAAENYKKAFENGMPNAELLYKYIKAVDFKYRYFVSSREEKKKEYMKLIKKYEPYNKQFSGKKEFNYCMAILWGRRGEITQDEFDSSNKDIAEKIRKYADALYIIDRKFEGYAACKILGRIHYKTPNIPIMLTWPDRKKSKALLEEAVKGDPGNSEAQVFLADTVWDFGDKERAVKIYRRIARAVPRKNYWYYDSEAIKLCKTRMEALGIK